MMMRGNFPARTAINAVIINAGAGVFAAASSGCF